MMSLCLSVLDPVMLPNDERHRSRPRIFDAPRAATDHEEIIEISPAVGGNELVVHAKEVALDPLVDGRFKHLAKPHLILLRKWLASIMGQACQGIGITLVEVDDVGERLEFDPANLSARRECRHPRTRTIGQCSSSVASSGSRSSSLHSQSLSAR